MVCVPSPTLGDNVEDNDSRYKTKVHIELSYFREKTPDISLTLLLGSFVCNLPFSYF